MLDDEVDPELEPEELEKDGGMSRCRRTPDLARVLRFSRGVDVWKDPSF